MQKRLIVGNMKMNPVSPVEMERYLDFIEKELKGKIFERSEIVICPPDVFFSRFLERKFKNVKIGAQNIFWEYQGAYTGEMSAAMAKNVGASYSLVGHSERRKYFGEDDEIANRKLKSILKAGLQGILCVGESIEERKSGRTADVLKKQLKNTLSEIGPGKLDFLTIAYEPIWAVGTDNFPTSDEILEAKLIIKKILVDIYDRKPMQKVRILYGGSVNVPMVGQVCLDPAMDGALIGRQSLMPHEFVKIAKIIDES